VTTVQFDDALNSLLIELPNIGFKIHCDVDTQLVTRLEVTLPSDHLNISLNGISVLGGRSDLSSARILGIFPPTKLGRFDESTECYVVDFDHGVRLRFRIPSDQFSRYRSMKEHPTAPVNSGGSPYLQSIELTQVNSTITTSDRIPQFEIQVDDGMGIFMLQGQERSWIPIGCSIQDVFTMLGSPDDIHGNLFNYFRLGVDFKADEADYMTVRKFIFHFNRPGHVAFGRYERAHIRVIGRRRNKVTDEALIINHNSRLEDFISRLGDPGAPLVVNNPGLFAAQHFYAFGKGICVEFMASGHASTVEVSDG
jgi:hypothetical protein